MSEYATVGILSAPLLAFLLWREYRRPHRGRLGWRLVAVSVAVLSLACLAWPVTYLAKEKTRSGKVIGLLTPGYHPDSLSAYPPMPLYTTDTTLLASRDSVTWIADLPYFLATHPEVHHVHIFGHGPADVEVESLPENCTFRLHPAASPPGITSIHWQPSLPLGDPLLIQGTWHNPEDAPVRLILQGLETRLDSLILPADSTSQFTLQTVPKHLGQAVYTLLAITHQDTLLQEKVPVETLRRKKLRILMLSAAPDFDIKFLKNWLYACGYEVAVRQTISRDLYSQEFLNMDARSLQPITRELLKAFDVVIADQLILEDLPRSQVQALQRRLSEGLGLLISSSQRPAASVFDKPFSLQKIAGQRSGSRSLTMPLTLTSPIALKAAPSRHIRQRPHQQPLVTDDQGHILAASVLAGEGKVLLSTLKDTYRLMLEGRPSDYAALWSELIGQAAPLRPAANLSWQPALPVTLDPLYLRVQTETTAPSLTAEGVSVPLQQDAELPFTWEGPYWPAQAGWLQVADAVQDTSHVYVFEETDWQTVRLAARCDELQRWMLRRQRHPPVAMPPEMKKATVPKTYFFVIFLVCCSFLWIEHRISRQP